jgi:hypothetical protein
MDRLQPKKVATVIFTANLAKVAELVDALDLGSCGVTRESSSLSFRTNPLPAVTNDRRNNPVY